MSLTTYDTGVRTWLKELLPQLDPKCAWRLQTPEGTSKARFLNPKPMQTPFFGHRAAQRPTCPGERLRSPRCAAQSLRSRRSPWGSPGPGSACEERVGLGVMAKDGVTSCLAPLERPRCHHRRGQEELLLPDVSCWVLRPQIPPGHGLENGPHGPSSSPSHHWRSLPHHELRPARRRLRRGRRGEGGHPVLGPGARLYSLHGLEEGLAVIREGHDELQLGATGLLHWKGAHQGEGGQQAWGGGTGARVGVGYPS